MNDREADLTSTKKKTEIPFCLDRLEVDARCLSRWRTHQPTNQTKAGWLAGSPAPPLLCSARQSVSQKEEKAKEREGGRKPERSVENRNTIGTKITREEARYVLSSFE